MDSQLGLLLGGASRPALDLASLCDDEERAVARALRWSRAAARQVPAIAAETGIAERRVQDLVQHLLHAHHWPIGTAMSRPFGNYLIESPEDLEATVDLLTSRGISNLARAAALRRMTVARFLSLVQTQLELERSR